MAAADIAPKGEFGELKALVRDAGLLDKKPALYVLNVAVAVALLAAAIGLLILLRHSALVLLDAVFLAFAFTQIGFIVHDAGHREVARSGRRNDILGLFLIDLLVGGSYGWWTDKHNRHHSNPNDIDLDPDLNIGLLAFSPEQAVTRPRVFRPIIRYQAFILPLVLPFEAVAMLFLSARFLVRDGGKYRWTEVGFLTIHWASFLVLLFSLLTVGMAAAFLAVYLGVMGVYLANSFAPNHKGMPTFDESRRPDYLRMQVITSRNLKGGMVSDLLLGGLGCQIEHHLFPAVPRFRLREVQKIVRPFCEERGIPYYETGFLRSWWEILTYMHEVGAPLRGGDVTSKAA